MKNKEKGALVLAAIMAKAITPEGFDCLTDTPKGMCPKAVQTRCGKLVKAGELFKAKLPAHLIRYFVTAEAARAFRAAHIDSQAVKLAKDVLDSRMRTRREPKPKPAASQAAQIVCTPQTRYSSSPMAPGRYEASVPFVRIGEPGFAMRVGAGA